MESVTQVQIVVVAAYIHFALMPLGNLSVLPIVVDKQLVRLSFLALVKQPV